MSIQKIIQESINGKPLEMKEAFAEELRNRVAEALAAKMEEVELDESDAVVTHKWYSVKHWKDGSDHFDNLDDHLHGHEYKHAALGNTSRKRPDHHIGIPVKAKSAIAYMEKHAKPVNESVEQIDEISKATLGSYIKKAGGTSLNSAGAHMADYGANRNPKSFKKGINRAKGVMRAADRLTKEEVDLDEAFVGRETKDGTWRVFKTGNPVAVAGPFKSAQETQAWIKKQSMQEEVDLDEAVEVRHDRYMRSHGKKASGTGGWFFTHKSGAVNNLDDKKEVHFHQGKFSDAAKSAKAWAKEHGHSAVYVMEEVEQIDELDRKTLASYVKKAAGVGHRNTLPNAMRDRMTAAAIGDKEWYKQSGRNADNRSKGIQRAADRLAKE
jgi:hypothetical protein